MKISVLLALLALSLTAQGAKGKGDDGGGTIYSNSWAVEIAGGDEVAELLADKHGFTNLGRVSGASII